MLKISDRVFEAEIIRENFYSNNEDDKRFRLYSEKDMREFLANYRGGENFKK